MKNNKFQKIDLGIVFIALGVIVSIIVLFVQYPSSVYVSKFSRKPGETILSLNKIISRTKLQPRKSRRDISNSGFHDENITPIRLEDSSQTENTLFNQEVILEIKMNASKIYENLAESTIRNRNDLKKYYSE